MGVPPSRGVAKIINRDYCGGNKKAGIAPTTGMNNAEYRHVMSDSVSKAMVSMGVTCTQTCTKGGYSKPLQKYWIPSCTLRPDQGGVGKHYRIGTFIW